MIFPADTSVKDMTTFDLQVMLEDIQTELHDRQVKVCQRYMMELVEQIEQVQAKKFNIYLKDIEGNVMELNHITEIFDYTYDAGYVFGNHPDISGEEDTSIISGPTEVKPEEEEMECIHPNDNVMCSQCEARRQCWTPEYWDSIEKAKENIGKE